MMRVCMTYLGTRPCITRRFSIGTAELVQDTIIMIRIQQSFRILSAYRFYGEAKLQLNRNVSILGKYCLQEILF